MEGWTSTSGIRASTDRRTEANRALAIRNIAYVELNSHSLSTLSGVQTRLRYDLLLPLQQPNQWWFGHTQLLVSIPSRGVFNVFVGQRELTGLPLNRFVPIEFELSSNVVQLLRGPYPDLSVKIVLNVPQGTGTYILDNLRFAGNCSPATVNDGNPCTVDTCSATGQPVFTPRPSGTSCSDGDVCNGDETCDAAGACRAGTPPETDDGDPCTADSCSATGGVSHVPLADGSACDDGNACTLADVCEGAVCAGKSGVICPASDDCHAAGVCNPATGTCSDPPSPDGTACDDGNACTLADICEAGTCMGKNAAVCAATTDCPPPGVCDLATGTCTCDG